MNDRDARRRFNLQDGDCPVFYGVYEFYQLYAGASISAARELTRGRFDIAINWSGGLHHARRSHASGFCYVNDVVLAILELHESHYVTRPSSFCSQFLTIFSSVSSSSSSFLLFVFLRVFLADSLQL
ncbi:hypothetical protein OPV22_008519 [Ensete ventricosum]|uniref:Histone deacetylase domain-containing protein n=1 Tax=Ensete ventricosum TaxID=4639 RepID=A0AAV8RCF1_ENSVE|nr:hypothetical protein OPV22_008519 [Ensete ventricosum]